MGPTRLDPRRLRGRPPLRRRHPVHVYRGGTTANDHFVAVVVTETHLLFPTLWWVRSRQGAGSAAGGRCSWWAVRSWGAVLAHGPPGRGDRTARLGWLSQPAHALRCGRDCSWSSGRRWSCRSTGWGLRGCIRSGRARCCSVRWGSRSGARCTPTHGTRVLVAGAPPSPPEAAHRAAVGCTRQPDDDPGGSRSLHDRIWSSLGCRGSHRRPRRTLLEQEHGWLLDFVAEPGHGHRQPRQP